MLMSMRGLSVAVFGLLIAASAAGQSSSDMFVTKNAPAKVNAGSNVTYTISVGNGGPSNATNASFTDMLPGGATFVSYQQNTGPTFTCGLPNVGDSGGTVSCSIATLTSGTTATFTIVVNASAQAIGTTLVNSISVTSQNPDPNPNNNSATTATAVGPFSDMSVTKNAPATANVGSNVTYTISVTNGGPDGAPNASFTDTLPGGATFVSYQQNTGPTFTCTLPNVGDAGGTVSCSIATLTTGTTATFTIVVNVSAPAAGTTLVNSVSVTSDNPDPNPENNNSITGTSVPGGNSADVSILKTGPGSAPPNSNVTYTITVSNSGPNAAQTVSWSDTLPAGTPPSQMTFVSFNQTGGPSFNCGVPSTTTTCTIASLAVGATATFQLVGHIPNGTATGTDYTNVATVTSANDPNPDNDSSATALTVSSVDVGVTKTGPATAVAGGPTYNYIITLTNAGPDTAADVTFTDNLPSGLTFVSLMQNTGPAATCSTPPPNSGGTVSCTISLFASGGSAQFTLTVQPLGTIPNGTIISNTATATTSSADTNPANNSATANTTITSQADVSITKSAPATVIAGNNITYSITVANAGPSAAASVSWSDTLPPNTTFVSEGQTVGPPFNCTTGPTITCSILSLASGASATFSLTVKVSPATPNGSSISNTATVTSSTPDPTPGNNSSTASTLVSANADLSVTKNGPPTTPSNTNVTYIVNVANAGPSNAATVTLTETVPTGMTFVSVNQTTGPAFVCSGTGPIVCTIASFVAGATASFQFTFNVPPGLPSGTSSSDTATISATTPDSNPANNTAMATTTVGPSIPALSPLMLVFLALTLGLIAAVILRH
jgi:uncharacterized repeat protein (TIGR01451 family)